MSKIKQLTSKLQFLRQRKYFFLFVTLFILLSLFLLALLMYFEPISKVDIDIQNNTLKVSKFPLYDSSLVIKQEDNIVFNNSLNRGVSEDISFEKKDGKYTYELKIGRKTIKGEFIIDTIAPEISIKYTEYVNTVETEVSFEFNEDISKITLTDKDDVEISVNDNKSSLKLTSGENVFSLKVKDHFNNESSKEFKVILDTEKPVIEILNPTSEETFDGSIEAKIKVTDSSPIAKVTINDQEASVKEDGNYSVSINLQEGNNDINFSVTDKAGNSEIAKKSINKKTQPAQSYNGGGGYNGGGNNSGGGNNGGGSGCSTALSGTNIHCWNNVNRANAGQGAIGWNDSSATMAYWYAYCLQTTGFSGGNPHQPTQAVKDCLTNNGQPIDRGSYGAEVIASGQGSADGYANAWKNSPAHATYVLSPYASNFGVAVYGNWAVGYIQ